MNDHSLTLRTALLRRLASNLRAKRPDLLALISQFESKGFDSKAWNTTVGTNREPEVALLTAIYDVDMGLSMLHVLITRVSDTAEAPEWDSMVRLVAVAYDAILQRVDDLLKIFERRKAVDAVTLRPLRDELRSYREDDDGNSNPVISLRHETVHSVQGHNTAVNRAPESAALWEHLALANDLSNPVSFSKIPSDDARSEIVDGLQGGQRDLEAFVQRCYAVLNASAALES